MPKIHRIGLPPTPAERTARAARENPKLLLYMARLGYFAALKRADLVVAKQWENLSEEEQELWIERALTDMDTYAKARHGDLFPDDPNPGASSAPNYDQDSIFPVSLGESKRIA